MSELPGNTTLNAMMLLSISEVNAKNDKGLTTLDLVMQLDNNADAVSMLSRRAKKGSSITPTPLADYLNPFITFGDWIVIWVLGDYFLETGIPDQMRSAALVVSALIVTTAYQGVLRPPGLVSSQTPIILNITSYFANNSSITSPAVRLDVLQAHQANNISKTELRQRGFTYAIGVMLPNSCALATSLGMIFLLLPDRFSIGLIHLSLICLIVSTTLMLANTEWWLPNLKFVSWVITFSFEITFLLIIACIKIISWRKKNLKKSLIRQKI